MHRSHHSVESIGYLIVLEECPRPRQLQVRQQNEGAENEVIRPRAFFCVDTSLDIRPEPGVEGFAHWVQLDNLYDVHATPLRLMAGSRSRDGHRTHH